MKIGQLNSIGDLCGEPADILATSGWVLTIETIAHVFLLEDSDVDANAVYSSLNKITGLIAGKNEHISHPCKDTMLIVHHYPTILKATQAAFSMACGLDQVRGWNLTYEAMCLDTIQNDAGMVMLDQPVEGMSWHPVKIHKTAPGGIPLPPWETIVDWGLPTETKFIDTMAVYARHLRTAGKENPKTYRLDSILESELGISMEPLKTLSPESGIKWWMDVFSKNQADIVALTTMYSHLTTLLEESKDLEF